MPDICKEAKKQSFKKGKKVGYFLAKRYMTRTQLNQETRMGLENIAVKHKLATSTSIRKMKVPQLKNLILGGENRQRRLL